MPGIQLIQWNNPNYLEMDTSARSMEGPISDNFRPKNHILSWFFDKQTPIHSRKPPEMLQFVLLWQVEGIRIAFH